MGPYETAIMRSIPGNTPKEKYEHFANAYQLLQQIGWPRRGTEEESWDIDQIASRAREIVDDDWKCAIERYDERDKQRRDSAALRLLDALRAKVEKWGKRAARERDSSPYEGSEYAYNDGKAVVCSWVAEEIDRAMSSTDQ